ncbi:YlbD family protein [Bacillus sp. FJAT-49705]|uniref:YlbD family protein n=1 Tax=Cytobacillus citreus TaxID=2833586 RepID=A0ABS5NMR4_9BACI|nr:YlbD family protein [Cytobacillus citreus]MBS4189097.1 YlbD family protein [Cytobacillus citreus]
MTKKKLHPSIEQFKGFVKNNPKIIQEVRSGKHTLQELFEDWYLLGEDDSRWDTFRNENHKETLSEEKKSDWMTNIMDSLKKMDPNQMEGYIQNVSKALSTVQGVISQFQGGGQINQPKSIDQKPKNPFVFNKD